VSGSAGWLPALPPFLLASIVTIAVVPGTMVLARHLGAMAEPDADRHLHPEPTPRLGGIALFAGFAVAVLVFGSSVPDRWQVLVVTGAITAAMLVDDMLDLPWNTKLAIELAAGVAAAALGITINFFAIPGGHGPSVVQLGLLAAPITAVFVLGMEVSINLLDGSDGVAAGVVAIVATVLMLAAVNRVATGGDLENGVIVMSGALMGCCAGFLVFNLPPARVFMGDTGSHFLGVALALTSILGVAKIAVALALFVPLIALGLPIGDTAFAIVRRRRAGLSPTQPDAGHLHHRMLRTGMSPMETALTFYLMTAILGCIALFIFGHRRILDVALALLVVALGALIWRLRRRPRHPHPPGATAAIDADASVLIRGRGGVPARIRRGGESD
jgi:UDP-GlcNAc:undecaprenyl-phosphate GlcNAc-1-phosphate transferase